MLIILPPRVIHNMLSNHLSIRLADIQRNIAPHLYGLIAALIHVLHINNVRLMDLDKAFRKLFDDFLKFSCKLYLGFQYKKAV